MNYCPGIDSYIRDQVIVVLDLSIYATNEEVSYATGVDTSNLAVKSDFIGLKAKVYKVFIKTSVNV